MKKNLDIVFEFDIRYCFLRKRFDFVFDLKILNLKILFFDFDVNVNFQSSNLSKFSS